MDVRKYRTEVDRAHQIRGLVEVRHPTAERIVLVPDDLNTHPAASPYGAFPPAEARRLADTREIRHTPTHGSWLNLAEIAPSVLGRQCLDRRIPDEATLEAEVAAWQARRDRTGGTVDWRSTTDDARIKLKRLYPSFHA